MSAARNQRRRTTPRRKALAACFVAWGAMTGGWIGGQAHAADTAEALEVVSPSMSLLAPAKPIAAKPVAAETTVAAKPTAPKPETAKPTPQRVYSPKLSREGIDVFNPRTPLGKFAGFELQPATTPSFDPPPPPPAPGSRVLRNPSELEPRILAEPKQPDFPEADVPWIVEGDLYAAPRAMPLGYTGPSGVAPTESQTSSHFVPIEDRWRIGLPQWDRYGRGHPVGDDYPYVEGHWWDPYNQNVLKGDYPIIGQHTFFNFTATNFSLFELRQIPTATTPFESTVLPFKEDFFGNPNQFFFTDNLKLSFNLLHGDAAFKPADWQIRLSPTFNYNRLDAAELGIVDPDVRKGRIRNRENISLDEWFVETKLCDLSPYYDFASIRAGSQFFTSDFRGFIFSDTNRAVRLFGTQFANRDEFNILWFDQTQKDINSLLNTFRDRHQNTVIANYYRQDFIWPGYTAQMSYHYNRDGPSFAFDQNDFLARPDPVGVARQHRVDAHYIGWAGEGHINKLNIAHAFYQVLGYDNLNPLAGRAQSINAQMAALELSVDRDWSRFRTSFFYASGDGNTNDQQARGFDSIFDNPNFAGGQFSYWVRQQIPLFGVQLVNRLSLVPDLRSSKFLGQTNFVNPGLFLYNLGYDADITPKLKAITNCNFLWFDRVNTLQNLTFQDRIRHDIGTDASLGFEYRPLLNNNVIFSGGVAGLFPGAGFHDIYDPLVGRLYPLGATFLDITLTY